MTADKIKALREAKGWTQADLARKLGIEHSAIVDVSGLNDKDVAVLAELADRLRNRNH